jgi:hypothetical protein
LRSLTSRSVEIRAAYDNSDFDRFYRLRAGLGRRYDKLSEELDKAHIYDGSVERRLWIALFNLVAVSRNEAEKTIGISLDYCRWHQMNKAAVFYGVEQNPRFLDEQEDEQNRFEGTTKPILQKAVASKLPRLAEEFLQAELRDVC